MAKWFKKIPEKLKPVIESIGRIINRELNDLCSLLIIDQLNFFHQAEGEILRYMKDYDIFRVNIYEGIITQAPAGRRADIFVLKIARKQNCRFITNDKYSDPEYREEFGKEWIRENRITFIFTDGVLVLD